MLLCNRPDQTLSRKILNICSVEVLYDENGQIKHSLGNRHRGTIGHLSTQLPPFIYLIISPDLFSYLPLIYLVIFPCFDALLCKIQKHLPLDGVEDHLNK